ncbi:hypothetical protein PABG_03346 [Paracoccidioides brasiliensis Pb03]|nr:hypothetical protein PABG_03346 [Paracoccidioides brasiliensis Pb03]
MKQENGTENSPDKETFCKSLYEFDGYSDSSQDVDELAVLLRQARKRNSPNRTLSRSPGPGRLNMFSDCHSLKRHKISDGQEDIVPTAVPSDRRPPVRSAALMRRSTVDGVSGKSSTAKRRQKSTIRLRPEHQQIFNDMVFFFIPNDDIAPARRMRINKALEFGASRLLSWNDTVTHVVVDKTISFSDVLKYLKRDALPSSVFLVNESYPAECITFGSLMNPCHTRFHVNGAPVGCKRSTRALRADESGMDDSPHLKPALHADNLETPAASQTICQAPHNTPFRPTSPDAHRPDDYDRVVEQSSVREPDILDEVTEQARAENGLPLDESEEEDAELLSDSEAHSSSDSEASKRKDAKQKRSSAGDPNWQQSFSCLHKHDGHTDRDNPNARTIEILQQMLEYYNRISDRWRTLAYRRAISALRKQKHKIVTKDQALAIPCIGEQLASKIEEIVWTNRLRRLEEAKMEPQDMILSKFLNIYGVGFTQASKWIQKGYQSLEDLKSKASLTKNQRIGIEHYDDFMQRIPRAEVEAHVAIVKEAICNVDPAVQVFIGGSYRRGASSSGDIDLLITKDGASQSEICVLMTDRVIPELFKQNFLQVSLAVAHRGQGSKWHGACALPGNPVWRRIDFLFVPGDEIGAALIYFTGNDIFNRSLRLLASKKGMCLNQRGLFADVKRGENRVKVHSGHLLESRDEKRIFEILGVPFRPPNHRIC